MSNDMFMTNIALGGSTYDRLAQNAWSAASGTDHPGFGLATHSPEATLSYQFLQHIPNIEYDPDTLSYEVTGPSQFGFLHTDLELLGGTEHTWEQYRVFRLVTLNAVALGFNSLLVSGYGLPSEGHYCTGKFKDDDKCKCDTSTPGVPCNFDYDAIDNRGAPEFLEWMNKVVGTDAASSPEAYCTLVDVGRPVASADDFEGDDKKFYKQVAGYPSFPSYRGTVPEQVAYLKAVDPDTWGEVIRTYTAWGLRHTDTFTGQWRFPHLRAPQVTHFGHLCTLLADGVADQGLPALTMEPADLRPLDKNFGLITSQPEPALNTWPFTGDTEDGASFYPNEARSTGAGTMVSTPGVSGQLRFTFDDDWYSAGDSAEVAIKISFTAQYSGGSANDDSTSNTLGDILSAGPLWCTGEGSWRIKYMGETGMGSGFWTSSPSVEFNTDDETFDTPATAIRTATFRIPRPVFGRGGSSPDLIIEHVSGCHAAFLNVRAIKLP